MSTWSFFCLFNLIKNAQLSLEPTTGSNARYPYKLNKKSMKARVDKSIRDGTNEYDNKEWSICEVKWTSIRQNFGSPGFQILADADDCQIRRWSHFLSIHGNNDISNMEQLTSKNIESISQSIFHVGRLVNNLNADISYYNQNKIDISEAMSMQNRLLLLRDQILSEMSCKTLNEDELLNMLQKRKKMDTKIYIKATQILKDLINNIPDAQKQQFYLNLYENSIMYKLWQCIFDFNDENAMNKTQKYLFEMISNSYQHLVCPLSIQYVMNANKKGIELKLHHSVYLTLTNMIKEVIKGQQSANCFIENDLLKLIENILKQRRLNKLNINDIDAMYPWASILCKITKYVMRGPYIEMIVNITMYFLMCGDFKLIDECIHIIDNIIQICFRIRKTDKYFTEFRDSFRMIIFGDHNCNDEWLRNYVGIATEKDELLAYGYITSLESTLNLQFIPHYIRLIIHSYDNKFKGIKYAKHRVNLIKLMIAILKVIMINYKKFEEHILLIAMIYRILTGILCLSKTFNSPPHLLESFMANMMIEEDIVTLINLTYSNFKNVDVTHHAMQLLAFLFVKTDVNDVHKLDTNIFINYLKRRYGENIVLYNLPRCVQTACDRISKELGISIEDTLNNMNP